MIQWLMVILHLVVVIFCGYAMFAEIPYWEAFATGYLWSWLFYSITDFLWR